MVHRSVPWIILKWLSMEWESESLIFLRTGTGDRTFETC